MKMFYVKRLYEQENKTQKNSYGAIQKEGRRAHLYTCVNEIQFTLATNQIDLRVLLIVYKAVV